MHLLRELDSCIIVAEFTTAFAGCGKRDAVVDVQDAVGSAWRPDGDG